jgi:hypothetical protein
MTGTTERRQWWIGSLQTFNLFSIVMWVSHGPPDLSNLCWVLRHRRIPLNSKLNIRAAPCVLISVSLMKNIEAMLLYSQTNLCFLGLKLYEQCITITSCIVNGCKLLSVLESSKYTPKSRNYWVSGLCSSSGILSTRKQNIWNIGSVSVLRWEEGDTYWVGSLKNQSLDLVSSC